MTPSKNVVDKIVVLLGAEYYRDQVETSLGIYDKRTPAELEQIDQAKHSNELWSIINGGHNSMVVEKAATKMLSLLSEEFKPEVIKKIGWRQHFDFTLKVNGEIKYLKKVGARSLKEFEELVENLLLGLVLNQLESADTPEKCREVAYLNFQMENEAGQKLAFLKGFGLCKTPAEFLALGTGKGYNKNSFEFGRCVQAAARLLEKEELVSVTK